MFLLKHWHPQHTQPRLYAKLYDYAESHRQKAIDETPGDLVFTSKYRVNDSSIVSSQVCGMRYIFAYLFIYLCVYLSIYWIWLIWKDSDPKRHWHTQTHEPLIAVRYASRVLSHPIGPQRCPRNDKGMIPSPWRDRQFEAVSPSCFPRVLPQKKDVTMLPCREDMHAVYVRNRISKSVPNRLRKSTSNRMPSSFWSDQMSKYTSDRKPKYFPNRMLEKNVRSRQCPNVRIHSMWSVKVYL